MECMVTSAAAVRYDCAVSSGKYFTHVGRLTYDLVVLNEVFTHKATLLARTKYPYCIMLGRKSCFDLFDSGIIVLSAYPIIKTEREHYQTRRKWYHLASKGIILCRIQTPNGSEVDVYCTHMQAGSSNREQASRDAQAKQLGKFILRHLGKEGRWVVLVGDMNMGPARNPDLQGYSVHYSSFEDAKRRVGTHEGLKQMTNLRDVVSPGWEQDINRFLVRGIEDAEVEYLEKPRYDAARNLSDSERLVCRIAIPGELAD